jgi:gamma-glutamylcyclotransferase (GGCT)/AIG2-like uncharacterized protein YtfP
LERRITDRDVPISTAEMDLLEKLDDLLNYFEHVLYLEGEKLIAKRDRQAVLEYWFDLMAEDDRAGLRRYAARWGFERVANELDAQSDEYVAVYGSLRNGLALVDTPDLARYLTEAGSCKIGGVLYDLGEYPALVPGHGTVIGELFRVEDTQVFRTLDEYEQYDPHGRDDSLYIRRCVRLKEPSTDVWVYFYNGDVSDKEVVPSGDWRRHQQERSD